MAPPEIVELPDQAQGHPPRLYIATPCYGCQMTTAYMLSLLQLRDECDRRGIECFVDFIGNESLVQRARNIFAARFLRSSSTHLLFIDADIGFRPEAVFRLLEANKEIAASVYPKKAFNWDSVAHKLKGKGRVGDHAEPTHMMGLDYNINIEGGSATVEKGFCKVLDAATGFMMLRKDAVQRLADAYKDTLTCVNDLPGDRESAGYVKEYVALFDCMIDPKTRRYLSEDYSLNRRAQAVGIETWVDLGATLCHVGNYVYEGDLRQRFTMTYNG
jgi:hypothetical protein